MEKSITSILITYCVYMYHFPLHIHLAVFQSRVPPGLNPVRGKQHVLNKTNSGSLGIDCVNEQACSDYDQDDELS